MSLVETFPWRFRQLNISNKSPGERFERRGSGLLPNRPSPLQDNPRLSTPNDLLEPHPIVGAVLMTVETNLRRGAHI